MDQKQINNIIAAAFTLGVVAGSRITMLAVNRKNKDLNEFEKARKAASNRLIRASKDDNVSAEQFAAMIVDEGKFLSVIDPR